MSELKCCPFCGAEAELMIFNSEYETVTVRCTNEDCDITMGKAFFTDEEAIEHWNRRKPMANIVEKLEERTEFLKDCTKYGNESAEQQEKSYSTMMMYEVADLVEDLIDIVKEGATEC